MASDSLKRGDWTPEGTRSRPLADSVLRLIWEERKISRAEISRRTDLARSTVSEIVSMLLPTGLIAEVGPGPSRGGRRPIVLQFQDNACVTIGVEMGASHIAVCLMNLRGRVVKWDRRAHPVRRDPEGTRALVMEMVEACLRNSQGATRLVGIGVAAARPVNPERPEQLSEIVLPEWKGRHGFEILSDRFGVPLMVDNDANLGALAERWWGAGKGVPNFTYVKLATGIGAGHVFEGKIYRGTTGVAGEIGHTAIDPKGLPCICGLRGCLATLVGAKALVNRARNLLGEYPETSLNSKGLTIVDIEDAALAGDPLAVHLVEEAAQHLGVALAGLLNLLNPSRIIVGGDLARLGDLLLDPLIRTVRARTLVDSVAAADITTSRLGMQGIAVGAATLVLKSALANPALFPSPSQGLEVR